MTSSTEREQIHRRKKIAEALSRSAHDANIFNNEDRRELEELINDYFVGDSDKEKESVDANDVCVETSVRNTCQPSETDELDTDSEEETPLVEATAPKTDIDINDETSLTAKSEHLKVEVFDCTKSATFTPSSSDTSSTSGQATKTGCIGQFTSEEILARRLNMTQFSEGKCIIPSLSHLFSCSLINTLKC